MSFFSWLKTKEQSKSQLEEIAEGYLKIDYSIFKDTFKTELAITEIMTVQPNILSYTKMLNNLCLVFEDDKIISTLLLPNGIIEVTLRDFFIDKKYYLDPVLTIRNFSIACNTFLLKYNEKEKLEEKSFNTEKNLLLTQNIVNNIVQIYTRLQDVSKRQ